MSKGTGALTIPMMFMSSYAPLFVLLAIRFDGCTLRLVCAGLAVFGFAGLFVLMRFQHEPGEQQGRFTLKEVRQAGEGASSYLSGYLLPFVTVGNPQGRDLVAYTGFFVVAYLVTTRTGIIQVNPTLFLAGYCVYTVTDLRGAQRLLLSRSKGTVSEGATVVASRMTSDVFLLEYIATDVT